MESPVQLSDDLQDAVQRGYEAAWEANAAFDELLAARHEWDRWHDAESHNTRLSEEFVARLDAGIETRQRLFAVLIDQAGELIGRNTPGSDVLEAEAQLRNQT